MPRCSPKTDVKHFAVVAAFSVVVVSGCGGQSASTQASTREAELSRTGTFTGGFYGESRSTRLAELERKDRAEFKRLERREHLHFFRAPHLRHGQADGEPGIAVANGRGKLEQRAMRNVEATFYYNRR